MTITIKCLYCDGIGRVTYVRPDSTVSTMTCPSCYGVATQRTRVSSLDDVDARSIVQVVTTHTADGVLYGTGLAL